MNFVLFCFRLYKYLFEFMLKRKISFVFEYLFDFVLLSKLKTHFIVESYIFYFSTIHHCIVKLVGGGYIDSLGLDRLINRPLTH